MPECVWNSIAPSIFLAKTYSSTFTWKTQAALHSRLNLAATIAALLGRFVLRSQEPTTPVRPLLIPTQIHFAWEEWGARLKLPRKTPSQNLWRSIATCDSMNQGTTQFALAMISAGAKTRRNRFQRKRSRSPLSNRLNNRRQSWLKRGLLPKNTPARHGAKRANSIQILVKSET